jgi:hypothetical protein
MRNERLVKCGVYGGRCSSWMKGGAKFIVRRQEDDPLRNSGSMISHLVGPLLRLLQLDHSISDSGQQFVNSTNLGVTAYLFISR